jgi:pilus assembly protein CpaC
MVNKPSIFMNGYSLMDAFRGAFLGLLCALVILPVAPSWASKENLVMSSDDIQRHDPLMILTIGKAEIVEIDGAVSDIMVADPDIIDVVALQANRMYMVGAKVGNTNVIALDAEGNVIKRLNVHVRVDENTLEQTLAGLFPDEKINAKTVNEQVILTGEVSNASVAAQSRDLAVRFVGDEKNLINLIKVKGEQQVMLKVRILEASRTVLKELGVETKGNHLDANGQPLLDSVIGSTPGGVGTNIFTNGQTGLTEDPFGVGRLIYDTGIGGIGFAEILINALEQDNLINTLAEPNLTAVSGEEASFLAGGEFPIPTGRDNQGNIVIEYKPFGVSLNFRPRVLDHDRISLQLKTEVSSLDFDQGLVVAQISVPGLDVRRAQTIVELNSGGSLMIAGLLKSDTIKGLSGLPGVRNTPILGDLISSDSFKRDETELLIVVTPYIVKPVARRDNVVAINDTDVIHQPLSDMFISNLRHVYGDRAPKSPDMTERLGYLID